MGKIVLVVMVTCLGMVGSCGGTAGAEPAGILDGKVFVGHVGPKGGEANGEDELVFQDGLLLSTSCIRYGFETAPYTTSQQGARILFEAVIHSDRHGQIVWRGHVAGDRAEAVYVWTKERWYWFDAFEENWFKGRLKQE